MLKNKKAIYILIPLNIFIWSYFVYRFCAAYTDGDVPLSTMAGPGVKQRLLKDSAVYKLSLDYKDPFLKEERKYQPERSTELSMREQKPAPVAAAKTPTTLPLKLPELKYLGLIRNTSSGQVTALVSINGQSRLMKINEVAEGIQFKSFSHDSLVAKWGKEKLVVRR